MKKTRLFAMALMLMAVPVQAEKLSLMLDWFPNIDHLPIYVAQEAGYFKDHGLTVAVVSPSGTADGLKLAAAGQVDVAVSYQPQAIIAAAGGIPVRVVGRLVASPLTTLLYLEGGGIATPEDLSGKKIGYTVPGLMDVLLAAFADINGIRDYEPVNVGFAIAQSLTTGKVAAVMGPFKNYETVTMGQKGIRTGFFELEKYGIPSYDELIFVTGAGTYASRREALHGFSAAVAEAMTVIARDPDRALAHYFSALPEADRDTETAAFRLTVPYYAKTQTCDRARWQAFSDFAHASGLISTKVDVRDMIGGDR
jgi:putative hydroxymethylpyrimidine transport system substrate-binding protein